MTNLNLTAPINPLGYGQIASNLIGYLTDLGIKVGLWPIGEVQPQNNTVIEYLHSCIALNSAYSPDAPSVRIWHQHDLAQHVGRGPTWGWPVFELDNFSAAEIHQIESVDGLIVCSDWAKGVVERTTNQKNVHVVPLGVDTSIFNPLRLDKSKDVYRFINIGKWEIRKGHDVLLDAFRTAFRGDDKVELWMMNHNPFLTEKQTEEWCGMYKSHFLSDKVKLIPRVSTHLDVAEIIASCNCGVFPSRAEGWNLEALECLATGLDLIITNVTAHTEICTKDNSCLIECPDTEEAFDGVWFDGKIG